MFFFLSILSSLEESCYTQPILKARENGYVGGYMVKRLIEQAERQMAQSNNQ